MFGGSNKTFGQTTPSSTDQTQQEAPKAQIDPDKYRLTLEALKRCQSEVKAARPYIDSLEKQIKSKKDILSDEDRRRTLSNEAIERLKTDIGTLEQALEKAKKALESAEKEIKYLKSELDKTNAKLSRSRKVTKVLFVIIAILGASKALQ